MKEIMKTYEEMVELANKEQEWEEKENKYGEINSITIKVADKTYRPITHSEPEDATWERDLSEQFSKGETIGMRSMYEAFKKIMEEK